MNKRIRLALIIIAGAILTLGIIKMMIPRKIYLDGAIPIAKDAATGQITAKELILVEKLAECESSKNPAAINHNDNGSPSLGYLQFKRQTFMENVKRYHMLPYAEAAEYENFLMDKDTQIELAARMLREKDGLMHWKNCALKNGMILSVPKESETLSTHIHKET